MMKFISTIQSEDGSLSLGSEVVKINAFQMETLKPNKILSMTYESITDKDTGFFSFLSKLYIGETNEINKVFNIKLEKLDDDCQTVKVYNIKAKPKNLTFKEIDDNYPDLWDMIIDWKVEKIDQKVY